MLERKKEVKHINEDEFARTLLFYRNLSSDEQKYALAFVYGMEFQRNIGEAQQKGA